MPSAVPTPACLDDDTATAFVVGKLPRSEVETCEEHLADCASCRELIAQLAALEDTRATDGGLDATLTPSDLATAPGHGRASQTTRGRSFGRYILVDQLGAGGMGEVFSAFDPELDRKVALKVLHPRMRASGSVGDAGERLLREARTLAKISHPNVVPVYDVGTVGDDVYVAMEHIRGLDLRAWRKENSPSHREVIEVCIGAARGLAAAHEIGLVHRDFKPDNVLVDGAGRARVIDFGIARAIPEGGSESTAAELIAEFGSTSLDSQGRLTQTGALIGTPAYMAPEQFEARPADERSDQFSFCATVFEALSGERPHSGTSLLELAAKVTRGEREPMPADANVPKRILAVLDRGMSIDPADRFESMDALIAALEPPRRRLGWLVAALGIAAVIGVALAFYLGSRQSSALAACDVDSELDDTWAETHRATLTKRFEATGLPNAGELAPRAIAALDSYKKRWLGARRQACEATARETQTVADRDLRIACLDRGKRELQALLTILLAGKTDAIENSIQSIADLSLVERCNNAERLRGSAALPEAFEDSLAKIKALYGAGRKAEAQKALDALDAADTDGVAEAERLIWRSKLIRSTKRAAAVDLAFKAVRVAAKNKKKRVEAEAWMQAASASMTAGDKVRADRWVLHAEVAAELAGSDLALLTEVVYLKARIARSLFRNEESYDLLIEALALAEKAYGKDSPMVLRVRSSIGAGLGRLGRFEESLTQLEEVVRQSEITLGKNHPKLGVRLNRLGIAQTRLKRYVAAEESYLRSIENKTAYNGRKSNVTSSTIHNLGLLYWRRGDFENGEKYLTEAAEIVGSAEERREGQLAQYRIGLAQLHYFSGDFKRSLEVSELAGKTVAVLGIVEEHGMALISSCRALLALKRVDDAVTRCREAVGVLENGGDKRNLSEALYRLAEGLVAAGQGAEAVEMAERARELRRGRIDNVAYREAEVRFVLAKALALAKGESAFKQARALALEAVDLFEAGHPGYRIRLSEIRAFLESIKQ